MSETLKKYRKLPGRGPGVAGLMRLWEGDDHLLSVRTVFGVEQYRRYYYRDIEAFLIRRTSTRLAWNAALGGIALFLVAVALVIWFSAGLQNTQDSTALGFVIFFVCLAAVFLVLLLINTLRGPTCSFFVQTAAGLDRLGCPRRVGSARRILQRLQPAIEEAQKAGAGASAEAPASIVA